MGEEQHEADVIVYGGTSGGVAAAVQAVRMGKTAIIAGPDIHLGGLSSSGLGWADTGRKEVIGGIALEFYERVAAHYRDDSAWKYQTHEQYTALRRGAHQPGEKAMWVFEPHVAEQIYEGFVKECGIPVYRNEWLDRGGGVTKEGGRISAIRMLSGRIFRGKMFIDATYEGDLMAVAGVTYTVGREANSVYGETLNGVQTQNATYHQFESPVSPYLVPGEPSSGLVPRVHDGGPGEEGSGDRRVQAYCFRMCLTKVPENRAAFSKPEGYDAMQYELLARNLATGWDKVFRKFDPIPNAKTDTNNHGGFSTDNIGMNYEYPEASYERRAEIVREHEMYQKGLMWFLSNDPRVPPAIQNEMKQYGLAKDEFLDNGYWPHQIYVREARRMVSDFVMTELHLRRTQPTPMPIGMGSYNMDSHHVQRYVVKVANGQDYVLNEGDVQIGPGGPYPISYGAIVPKQAECTNLLVPVCVSSSHIAYGSIRMEPVFMILGQSAATAAVQAIDGGCGVQAIDYGRLRARLLQDGQVLELGE
ncbi:MAG TPA: FAD-dependent oxidoreductase [Candidatus Hydrogenedentes bacterium]|nr:FAD-dependent oxidoreductase [Candidatus Hydrogenedentota bacterium]HQM49747.1 FAD-dependent oxidoreductase [Candidatus Hydrogenedentota bacterium]